MVKWIKRFQGLKKEYRLGVVAGLIFILLGSATVLFPFSKTNTTSKHHVSTQQTSQMELTKVDKQAEESIESALKTDKKSENVESMTKQIESISNIDLRNEITRQVEDVVTNPQITNKPKVNTPSGESSFPVTTPKETTVVTPVESMNTQTEFVTTTQVYTTAVVEKTTKPVVNSDDEPLKINGTVWTPRSPYDRVFYTEAEAISYAMKIADDPAFDNYDISWGSEPSNKNGGVVYLVRCY